MKIKWKIKFLESKLSSCIDLIENHKIDKEIKLRVTFKVKDTINRIEELEK